MGAAIAYYTLFSLAPLLVILMAIAGFVFGAEAVRGEIVGPLGGLNGAEGATAGESALARASEPGRGLVAPVVGAVRLLTARPPTSPSCRARSTESGRCRWWVAPQRYRRTNDGPFGAAAGISPAPRLRYALIRAIP